MRGAWIKGLRDVTMVRLDERVFFGFGLISRRYSDVHKMKDED